MTINGHSDYSALAEHLDRHLSLGDYGDARALLADKATLYEGLRWLHPQGVDISAEQSEKASARIFRRARADAAHAAATGLPSFGAELHAGLDAAEAALSAVPVEGLRLRHVGDWNSPMWRRALDIVVEVLEYSGYREEIEGHRLGDEESARLADCVLLAQRALPRTLEATLPFISVLMFLNSQLTSMYLTQLPETIQLGLRLFTYPDQVIAESVLHEALHEKFTVICLTRRVTATGYTDARSPTVFLPWSTKGGRKRRDFPVQRSLSTLHVYTHLAALHVGLLGLPETWHDDHSPEVVGQRAIQSFERAAFLSEQLHTPRMLEYIGPDGKALLAWLTAALDRIRSVPGSLALPWRTFEPISSGV